MFKTKIIQNVFIVMTMFFAGFGEIFSAPASPRLFEITQPNGSKFKAYLRGDEYFSWWESEEGMVLFRNMVSGYFEYAKMSIIENKEQLVSTGVIFIAEAETTIPNANISNILKLNLGKIWRQKRNDARKLLQEKLEKQRQSVINNQ